MYRAPTERWGVFRSARRGVGARKSKDHRPPDGGKLKSVLRKSKAGTIYRAPTLKDRGDPVKDRGDNRRCNCAGVKTRRCDCHSNCRCNCTGLKTRRYNCHCN